MLTKSQLKKIKNELEKSQNPLFFFDNDVDGFCSFLILQRSLERGKGVAIKSFPELNKDYIRKINELNPDLAVILDKPRVSKDFIEQVSEKNLPILWIDHHNIQIKKNLIKKVNYYNSSPSSEPVTYIAQKIFNRKKDIWLALIGCIGDAYMPDFAEEFKKQYPELLSGDLNGFDSLYKTEAGKIVRILNFALKDTTTNVVKLIKFLIKANSPYDILKENPKTRHIHHRYNQINKTYQKLIKKAKSQKKGKIIYFEYSGNMSLSSEIANELYFENKDKIIIIAYKRHDKINVSIRGKNARVITKKLIKNIPEASGGGHEQATGAQLPSDNFNKFKENLIGLV
jgi:single-stranded DNA-specific DHH superfamily exonuclease